MKQSSTPSHRSCTLLALLLGWLPQPVIGTPPSLAQEMNMGSTIRGYYTPGKAGGPPQEVFGDDKCHEGCLQSSEKLRQDIKSDSFILKTNLTLTLGRCWESGEKALVSYSTLMTPPRTTSQPAMRAMWNIKTKTNIFLYGIVFNHDNYFM